MSEKKKVWTLEDFIAYYLASPDPDGVLDGEAKRERLKERCTFLYGDSWESDVESAMYAGMYAGSRGLKVFRAVDDETTGLYLAHGVDEDDAVRRLAAALDFELPEAE